jgi:lipoprotein-anchoring transpeptidase ErfK/SrfK
MRLTAALTLSFLALSAPAALASQVVFDPLTGRSVNATPSTAGGRAAATPIPRETVSYTGPHRPGTIVVNTAERRLYLVMPGGKAVKYGVGVGRPGFAWGGAKAVTRKAEWPSWTPPSQMLKRRPRESHGRPGPLPRLVALPHPWLERAGDDRPGGLLGLHPHAQR